MGDRLRLCDRPSDAAARLDRVPVQKIRMLHHIDTRRPVHRGGGGARIGGAGDDLGANVARRLRAGERGRLPPHLRQPRREVEIADLEVRAPMRDQRPRSDDLRIIAGHVRDREVEGAARGDALREASSLDARDALAHPVHGADREALGQQVLVHPCEVVGVEPFRQDLDERGGAARCERQHVRAGGDGVDEVEQGPAGREAGLVRHRMRGFDDLDGPARIEQAAGVAVLGDDERAFDAFSEHVERPGHHGRRRLAHREGETRGERRPLARSLGDSAARNRGHLNERRPLLRPATAGAVAWRFRNAE